MNEITGWLLDLYPHPQLGAVLWVMEEGVQERHRLHHPFPITFYAHGPFPRLREAWRYLETQSLPVSLSQEEKRDLFENNLLTMLAVQAENPIQGQRIFFRLKKRFPHLTYYNAYIPFSLRHAVRYGTFPLARCRIAATSEVVLKDIEVMDTAWDIDPLLACPQAMNLAPDVDHFHQTPKRLKIHFKRKEYRLAFQNESCLFHKLSYLITIHDPDLLLPQWGIIGCCPNWKHWPRSTRSDYISTATEISRSYTGPNAPTFLTGGRRFYGPRRPPKIWGFSTPFPKRYRNCQHHRMVRCLKEK